MTEVPITEEDEGLVKLHPRVFSSCVVTRAMAKREAGSTCTEDVKDHTVVDLAETFFCGSDSEMYPDDSSEHLHVDADGDVEHHIPVGPSETRFCDANFVETPESALPLDASKVSTSEEMKNEVYTGSIEMSRKQLIAEQEKDDSLSSLYADIISEEEGEGVLKGSFKKGDVLMRKWQPCALIEGAKSDT